MVEKGLNFHYQTERSELLKNYWSMETLSTDGPGCDLARKKKSFSPAADVRDGKNSFFPSPSRGSITHSFTLSNLHLARRSLSLCCARLGHA
jgi:hypothetical protein